MWKTPDMKFILWDTVSKVHEGQLFSGVKSAQIHQRQKTKGEERR